MKWFGGWCYLVLNRMWLSVSATPKANDAHLVFCEYNYAFFSFVQTNDELTPAPTFSCLNKRKKEEGVLSANWVLHGLDRRRCQQKPLLRRLPRPFGSLWGRGEERGEPDQEPRQLQVLHLRARLLPAAHVSLRLLLRQHPPQVGAGKVLSSNWLASHWVTCESDSCFLLFVSLHFQGEQNVWLPLRLFDGFIAFCDKKKKKKEKKSNVLDNWHRSISNHIVDQQQQLFLLCNDTLREKAVVLGCTKLSDPRYCERM